MYQEPAVTEKQIAVATGKSVMAINKRSRKEAWPFLWEDGIGRGGKIKKYPIAALPPDIQNAIIIYNKDKGKIMSEMLPMITPATAEKALEILELDPMPVTTSMESITKKQVPTWTPETAITIDDIRDKRIGKILAILREVEDVPREYSNKPSRWLDLVAKKHGIVRQTIYKWKKKYDKKGIAGLRHTKSYKNEPRKWTPEAVDFWIGLCLKREHRHINHKDLYDILIVESHRREWNIGGYESANWWFEKKASPLLIAYRDGGARALDNMLPPVLRDYSDLEPFEILVGDQHRFDFWVVDDLTGEVFRPEGYLWQDLRSRIIYGAALDKKYDANLIGLALRIGMRIFCAFKSIYTDNGKPELSKYVTGILADIRNLGMAWETTEDYPMDILDAEPENINPGIILPGTHKKAIVKNAKAKMIEGTFNILEGILRSRFMLPGNVKNLHGEIHAQDIDQAEAKRLAEQGKLPLASEFYLTLYQAIDYYNRDKHHRGLHREWAAPKPSFTAPMTCLKVCYSTGWRPVRISDEAADLIFLQKSKRIVRMGRVEFMGEFFEHDALLPLHKKSVNIRYNPLEADTLLIFLGNKYICAAYPAERSSMKDAGLATEKIHQKRARRKEVADKFRSITAQIPDFRNYSEVPELEKVVALVGEEKRQRAIEAAQVNRAISQEEIDDHIAKMEQGLPLPAKNKNVPERPKTFINKTARFLWLIELLKAGGNLSEPDELFKVEYFSEHPEQKEFFEFHVNYAAI